jgi:hypothetical protein
VTPAALIARASENGFAVGLDEAGPHLVRVLPGAALPPGLLADLKRHRDALAAYLTCRACGKPTDGKRRCFACEFRPCAVCDRATGSVLVATCFTCGVRS